MYRCIEEHKKQCHSGLSGIIPPYRAGFRASRNDVILGWVLKIILCLCGSMLLTGPSRCLAADGAGKMTLEQAMEIALAENPGFTTSRLGIQEAEHRKKSAGSDFLPKLKTAYSYTHITDTPELKMPNLTAEQQALFTVPISDDFSLFRVMAVQPVFTGGEIYNKFKLERLGVDIARLKNETARNDLLYNVKGTYFTVLKAEKLLDVARQAVAQIQSHEKTARDMFEQEMIAKNDLLEAQVRLAQAEQDQVRAEQAVELAKASFNTVLHRDTGAAVDLAEPAEPKGPGLTLPESQSLAKDRRPVLRQIETAVEQAKTGVRLASGTYFPKLNFVTAYNRIGDHAATESMKYLDANTYSMTLNMDWTFFEWGKKSNVVGEQKVKLLQAQETKKSVTDQVMLQVKSAWLRSQENWKNIGVSRTAIARAEENFRIYQNRFSQQMSTTTDVLDAQTLLTHAKSNYNNALYDYFISNAMLENATGGELR